MNTNANYMYQKRITIAGILGSLDEKIEINRRKITELEALAKLIYDHWFVQFDFPDANGKPYKSSGGKMVWNETLKRNIPEGWDVDNIYRIADYINGLACQKYRPSSKQVALPVIKIKEMHDGITDETEFVSSDIPEHYKISDGSMLFSWSATLETMIWTGGDGGLNQHIFKVVPHNGFPMSFVFLQVSAYIGNFVKMADARKTTMGHITTDHMKQSRILIPSQALLNAFASIGRPIFDKIIKNRKEMV